MQFLCHTHRNRLALLNHQEKAELWFIWMRSACCLADEERWQDVLIYSGCAYELAATVEQLYVEMTLAAISMAEAFRHTGHPSRAEQVIEQVVRQLEPVAPQEFIHRLRDEDWRLRFFCDYLSWPAIQPGNTGTTRSERLMH